MDFRARVKGMGVPSDDEVLALVGRIEASPGFVQSSRLCRFLRYTVSETLRGGGSQIKEYAIGREVFDRNESYDPRLDPIVRVEARRLRKKLDEYFDGPGSAEPFRIRYPKGSYAPVMEGPGTPTAVSRRRWLPALAAGLGAIAIGAVLFQRRGPALRAKFAVIPARWVWKTNEFSEAEADVDLAERITAELANSGRVRVADWPSMARFAAGTQDMRQICEALGADRALIIAVRTEAEGARLTAYLVDGHGGGKLHVADLHRLLLDTPERRQAISAKISLDIILVTAKV